MAQREALKELQTRLAARLQEARSQALSVASWLAVRTGGQGYLLPLEQSGEIFPWSGVQSLPYTQPWFLGVANLRGLLTGVVDLSGFLHGMQPRSESALAQASTVTLAARLEVNAALLVEQLVGLRGQEAFTASEPPAQGAPAYLGRIYLDAEGVRWQELLLENLSRDGGFLAVRG